MSNNILRDLAGLLRGQTCVCKPPVCRHCSDRHPIQIDPDNGDASPLADMVRQCISSGSLVDFSSDILAAPPSGVQHHICKGRKWLNDGTTDRIWPVRMRG